MKISKIVFAFLLAILFTAITSTVTPQIALAKICHDASGRRPVPCPQPRNTPTSVPATPTATECRLPDGAPCTPTPTACPLAPCTPTPASTAAATATFTPLPTATKSANIVAVAVPPWPWQYTPFKDEVFTLGPLGWILALLIGLLFTGGVFLLRFVFKIVFTKKIDWSGPGDEGPEEGVTFVYGKLNVDRKLQGKSDDPNTDGSKPSYKPPPDSA